MAGVAEQHGAQFAVRRAHREHRNIVIDRTGELPCVGAAAAPVHREARQSLFELQRGGRKIRDGAAYQVHHFVEKSLRVVGDDLLLFRRALGVAPSTIQAEHGSAMRV